jgi:hypothetical protein
MKIHDWFTFGMLCLRKFCSWDVLWLGIFCKSTNSFLHKHWRNFPVGIGIGKFDTSSTCNLHTVYETRNANGESLKEFRITASVNQKLAASRFLKKKRTVKYIVCYLKVALVSGRLKWNCWRGLCHERSGWRF